MKIARRVFPLLIVLAMALTASYAAGKADIANGKRLFNDPGLGGGTSGNSCNTCHPDGKGLENAGKKNRHEWTNPGGKWLNLEDTNNVCILMAMKGKPIDPKGREMKDLVAYIKSLAK
ncbi:MAG: hypothetical protein M0Z59_08185 [Nitrospiraceae bacterium]|nr:hypothetical protein [Nitrospiraceae bacterium]